MPILSQKHNNFGVFVNCIGTEIGWEGTEISECVFKFGREQGKVSK